MIKRFIQIYMTLCKETLDRDIFPKYMSLSYLLAVVSPKVRKKAKKPVGEKCLAVASNLGPLFIKLGQFLSTRPDILPADITYQLAQLQDNVSPIPNEIISDILIETFGKDYKKTFKNFNEKPMASASIAQVHDAELENGDKVVLKIRRPNLESLINQDLDALSKLSRLMNKLVPRTMALNLLNVIEELRLSLNQEIHLLNEAGHYAQMKSNFAHEKDVYIPNVHWDYCRDNVIVIERIFGIGIAQVNKLKKSKVNLKSLAEKGIKIFFTQLVEYRYFHADMHPGNIFIDTSDPHQPKYMPIDFGIMGYLSEEDQYYITQNLNAFLKRDFRKIAELHLESGWVPKDTRLFDLESSVRGVCAPLLDKPLGEISFAVVLRNLLAIGKQYNMIVQPQLILLQKTLFSVEGIGRRLCPDINVWEVAKPFMRQIEQGPTLSNRLDYIQKKLPKWLNEFKPKPVQPTPPPEHKHFAIKIATVLTLCVCAFILEHELLALSLLAGFAIAL